MIFLTSGQKIKKIRMYLNMNQKDLQSEEVSRVYVSMIEQGKRTLSKKLASSFAEIFKRKAEKLHINLQIDESYLLRSPKEDAELYCLERLENSNINENIEAILKIASEYDLLNIKGVAYSKMADFYFLKKDYDNAFVNYNKAVNIYRDIKQDNCIPHLYWRMGLCKVWSLQYLDALSYFNICEYYSLLFKDVETQQLVLYDKALCYKKVNKFNLALENIEKYLNISDKRDDFYFYANIVKADCHEAIGNVDFAIDIYNHLLEEIKNPKNIINGYIYNNLGLAYLKKNDFKTSLEQFEMAEKIISDVDKANLCHTLIEKSEVFFKQQLYYEAIQTIRLGLMSAEVYKDYEYLLKGNYCLVNIYKSMNDTSNLKKVYLTIANLLKSNNNLNELMSIYMRLSSIYLDENDIESAKKYLNMSQCLT